MHRGEKVIREPTARYRGRFHEQPQNTRAILHFLPRVSAAHTAHHYWLWWCTASSGVHALLDAARRGFCLLSLSHHFHLCRCVLPCPSVSLGAPLLPALYVLPVADALLAGYPRVPLQQCVPTQFSAFGVPPRVSTNGYQFNRTAGLIFTKWILDRYIVGEFYLAKHSFIKHNNSFHNY